MPAPNGHATRAQSVMLATKFPDQYVRETIVPGLADIGVHVARVVSTDFNGDIRGDAVLFMHQYCSHADFTEFKRRADLTGVLFLLLPRQRADWVTEFKKKGFHVPGHPVAAAELPKPPALIVGNGKPLLPPVIVAPPPVEPTPEPAPRPFRDGLRAEVKRSGTTHRTLADTIGVSPGLVDLWTCGGRVAPDHYEALLVLFPELARCGKPEFTLRKMRRDVVPPAQPAPIAAPAVAPVAPPPTEPVKPRPASLADLRRAALALGVTGRIALEVDESSTVMIGAEKWHGATPEDAMEDARRALDGRLGDLLRRVEEARAMLGGVK